MYTYSSKIEYVYDTRILFTKTCTLCRKILAYVIKLQTASQTVNVKITSVPVWIYE